MAHTALLGLNDLNPTEWGCLPTWVENVEPVWTPSVITIRAREEPPNARNTVSSQETIRDVVFAYPQASRR